MVLLQKHQLPPTALIPNSPHPLLHYISYFPPSSLQPLAIHQLFNSHAWNTQWIFRYSPTQRAHYHSRAHECMVVLSGSATIRFGAADTASAEEVDNDKCENGGVEIEAHAGDVFVIPSGVSHKTFNTQPRGEFALLSPGNGHQLRTDDGESEEQYSKKLGQVELSGFTMMGAYPKGGEWDFCEGGEDTGKGGFQRVWSVKRPEMDPILGTSTAGLCGTWDEQNLQLPSRRLDALGKL